MRISVIGTSLEVTDPALKDHRCDFIMLKKFGETPKCKNNMRAQARWRIAVSKAAAVLVLQTIEG